MIDAKTVYWYFKESVELKKPDCSIMTEVKRHGPETVLNNRLKQFSRGAKDVHLLKDIALLLKLKKEQSTEK